MFRRRFSAAWFIALLGVALVALSVGPRDPARRTAPADPVVKRQAEATDSHEARPSADPVLRGSASSDAFDGWASEPEDTPEGAGTRPGGAADWNGDDPETGLRRAAAPVARSRRKPGFAPRAPPA